MILRWGLKGIVPLAGVSLLILVLLIWSTDGPSNILYAVKDGLVSPFHDAAGGLQDAGPTKPGTDHPPPNSPELGAHITISSLTTPDKKYFPILFGDKEGYNPSIIPHQEYANHYIVVAQQQRSAINNTVWFAQLTCVANFTSSGALECISSATILPIAATFGSHCIGKLSFLGFNQGPHDARMYWGPEAPYVMYGSNSGYTCFGQFMQDLRSLVDWGLEVRPSAFRTGVELKRHKPYGFVEKNWFVFWDAKNVSYVHWDLAPTRSFAKVNADGSVGSDLARYAKTDQKCMAMYMPRPGPILEDIHQATNSLSITTCKRSDPTCIPDDSNTFIIVIFHYKSYHAYHGVYSPFVMLFQRSAPFAIHAIGQQPLWLNGRKKSDEMVVPDTYDVGTAGPWNQTEMVFVTSIGWMARGSRYHGYADDVMFMGFGLEDSGSGGLDFVAGDLLQELGVCEGL